jgi:hypothetical protein
MSRRAAGFIKECWNAQLQRGPIRLDPEEIRGPWGRERPRSRCLQLLRHPAP